MKNSKSYYFCKIATLFFAAIGIVLLVTPEAWWPGYYDLPYMGYAALICALFIAILPRRLKFPFAFILSLNASGDLGLYELYRYGFEYDKVIHFISPLIVTIAFTKILGLRRAMLIVVAGVLSWELYEFLADTFLKTHLFGVYRHQVFKDTVTDLIMNALGITSAIFIFLLRYQHYDRSGNINQSRGAF